MDDGEREQFRTWQVELMATMHEIGHCHGSGGCLIDAAIPFRLGWSPERAARALLFLEPADTYRLRALMPDVEAKEK